MLPAEEIKNIFPVVYRNDGIFILKDEYPLCWWIKNRPYPLELGTIKGNKTVNNISELIQEVVFLKHNIKIGLFEAFSEYIVATQIAKLVARQKKEANEQNGTR